MSRKVLKTIILYFFILLICTLSFVGLFHTNILKSLNVFMYRGCAFILVCGALAAGLMFLGRRWLKGLNLERKDAVTVCVLFCSITLAWFTLIPVTVERSISVFMLSYMEENSESSITAEDFGNIFYQKYIDDFGAFDKRFHEQVTTGSIEETAEKGHYVITERGRFLVQMFRLFGRLFDTEQWLIYPNEY